MGKTAFRETFLLMLGSIFGAIVAGIIEILLSDIRNWISWFMAILLMTVVGAIVYFLLKGYHHKK